MESAETLDEGDLHLMKERVGGLRAEKIRPWEVSSRNNVSTRARMKAVPIARSRSAQQAEKEESR